MGNTHSAANLQKAREALKQALAHHPVPGFDPNAAFTVKVEGTTVEVPAAGSQAPE